jgi:predicted DNA repair protein MutK
MPMAGGSLLLLLDDIATILDDVAVLTKVAARKTAGVLGDDLALNAQQVAGVRAHRELPVVFAVFKGSLLNKLILVPAALAISLWLPWLVTPLMMIGGAYLCYEGVEKLAHRFLHADAPPRPDRDPQRRAESVLAAAAAKPTEASLLASEKEKIRGAIRTDFILSAEIIVLSLGVVSSQPLLQQVMVLVTIALAMTFGVYGLVAGIVKLDDVGLWLTKRPGALAGAIGRGLLYATPWLMKTLSVVGTAAMFLVGGGILVHSVPMLHHAVEGLAPDGWTGAIVSGLCNALVGLVAGAVVLGVVTLVGKLRGGKVPDAAH